MVENSPKQGFSTKNDLKNFTKAMMNNNDKT
jgi:hypothetical protein